MRKSVFCEDSPHWVAQVIWGETDCPCYWILNCCRDTDAGLWGAWPEWWWWELSEKWSVQKTVYCYSFPAHISLTFLFKYNWWWISKCLTAGIVRILSPCTVLLSVFPVLGAPWNDWTSQWLFYSKPYQDLCPLPPEAPINSCSGEENLRCWCLLSSIPSLLIRLGPSFNSIHRVDIKHILLGHYPKFMDNEWKHRGN